MVWQIWENTQRVELYKKRASRKVLWALASVEQNLSSEQIKLRGIMQHIQKLLMSTNHY